MKKDSSVVKNVQVPRPDEKQTSVPSGAVAVVNDGYEKKEIVKRETTLGSKTKDPVSGAEAGVCFDESNVEDKREVTELLAPGDKKEFLTEEPLSEKANQAFEFDCSSTISKEEREQEKKVEECLLETASSEDVTSLAFTDRDKLTKTRNPSG